MRFLLTALGTNNHSTVCGYLKKNPQHYVVGVDMYPAEYVPASREADRFYQVGSIYDMRRYVAQLLEICKKEQIDFLFPVIDEEVDYLSRHKELFSGLGVTVCCANAQAVEICRDKAKTFAVAEAFFPDIYTRTADLKTYDGAFGLPVFVKPASGRASTGCVKIETEEDLRQAKARLKDGKWLVQEFLEGDFFTVDFVNDPAHNLFASLPRQELVRNKNGCGVVVQTQQNTALEQTVRRLVNHIGFCGAGNCEFIGRAGQFKLVEINPRISAGIAYSLAAGLDVVSAQMHIMRGEKPDFSAPLSYGKIYAKRYEMYEMR